MPKWVADAKIKKKEEEEKKTGASTKPQSSSVKNVNKKASNSTFMGGGSATKNVKSGTKKGPSEAKKREAAANASKRAAKSTFMGGTETTPVKRATTKTANNTRLTSNTTAAQRQKMGMPTQQDLQSARASRKALATSVKNSVREATSDENKGFMQRQKSGTLTTADKKRVEQTNQRRAKVVKNTGTAATKAVQDTVSGYGQTLADVDELAKSNRNWTTAKAQKMGIDLNDRARVSKVEQERQQSIREAREFRQELFDKQEQRQTEWDERTKNAKGLEKAWYGAVESGTGMLADTLVGAATGTGQFGALASMGLRTYGPSTMQARKEGATDKEARLYGLAQSGKEIATELMFQGAGLAKAAYGKTGLSLADKSANILTKGLTGLKADAVGAGVRALGGTAEENVEELAGWMADPLIKELTYGKAVRNRMKENLRANIPQIGSDADAANVASYFSTPQFTDELTKEYVKSGMSKDKASALAAEMRDYYVAYYSGDQGKLEALEEDLAAKLSGQDKLSLKSWSMDELKDTFASTTLLTLATGLPGAVTTSVKGNQIFDSDEVKAVFGADAVRKVADAVKNTSNKEMSLKAETMKDRLDSGKDLTGTQKFDLYQGYLEKVNETAKKARASYGVAENAREEQDLVPTMGVDRAGNTVYAKETQREYNEKFASTELTVEAIKSYMESDNSISDDEARRANAVKKAVADIHVGGLTVGDAHEFAYGNTLAREALKAEEGIDLDRYIVRKADGTVDLAATNEATENALFQINADNAIRAAQAETEVFIDDTRGNIDKDLLTRFGNNGQAVWKEVNKDLDPRDLQNYLTTANAAAYFYSAGRNTDMSVDTAINRYADTFKTVDNSVLKRAFAAGARDRIIANTPGYGQTVTSGSNIQLKKTKPIITGQLIMDKDVVIPDSDQSAYLALAMSTNSNIHIVSSLKSNTGAEINGMSHGNDIYLNMNAAAESNLGYVFMHEMTHQIKQYAPNEYLALENLVRDRWFNKDAAGMQKAIKDRIDLYSTKGGQQLTEEEAVEEIIADAMAEAMDDPDFAAQVCEEDINLGQAILNSIREALRSIRNMFASTEFKNDRFHNSLLSYLGILDEAEKMWLNALHTARQNKADGLIADWQDKANKQNSPRLSVPDYTQEEMDADYMKAVESNDMDTAQRMVDEAAEKAMPNTKLKGRWYHGTENEFTVFNFSQGGKNGTADGYGIYLTNDPKVAESYGQRMIEGYVNVERPASALADQTLTDIELHRLISRTVDVEAETLMYDEGYDNAGDAKKDTWISNYTNTHEAKSLDDAIDDVVKTITQFNGNDFDIIQEIMNGMGIRDYEQATAFYDILTEETGIDGFETKWGDESEMADPNTPTIALAFRSEQIKDASPVTYDDDGKPIPLSDRFDMSNEDIRFSLTPEQQQRDADYMDAVNSGNMEEAQRLVDEAAKAAGMKVAHRYHGTMNAGFTVFDKAYAKVGGNSGAGFYFSTEKDDSVNHYADVEGADNYFKWSSLAEHINDQINEGTWEGPELETYKDVEEYAKEQLNKNPGTYDVYLNYKNPYIRDYKNSTNIYDMLMDDFDESVIDRDDYEDEWEYEDAVWEAKAEHLSDSLYSAVYGAYQDIEDNYEVIDMPYIDEVLSKITEYAFDGSLTWEEIQSGIVFAGEVEVTNPNWTDSGDATSEFTRAIIENLGFDAIEDKEVNSKFGQLSREMMTDTEHIIVFKPEQIKLSDPVTYAEDGSVIPLSERFDPTNNDIRYSLPTQDSDGNILSDGQMEYFKNSQARDEQGRLVPVYHATDMGGFTIFDPWKSDDHRSLFFSDRRDVAKTYAYNGGNAFDFTPKELNDWGDLIQYGRQLFSDADMSWDNDTDDNNLDFELYDKASGNFADIGYDEWLSLVESNDPHADDYKVKIKLPYNNKDGETEYVSFEGDSAEDLLNKVSNGNIPHGGHYQVYLNLENPLIIDGQGQPWNDIVDGGSVFPAYSSITLRNRSWFEDEAESRDKMYELGQSLYNGDNARARAQEFEGDDYVEIEIFNGKKKIKAIIPLTEEAVAEEAAAAFGVDDRELLQGFASEIVGDMEFGNTTKIYGDDMRGTIGEYGYSTREWAEFAEDEGYDGVIFRDIIDTDNKTEMFDSEEEAASDIYVAFSSNQVKDTRNENPTENPDIRYSITPEDEAMEWLASQYELDDVPLDDEQAEEGRVRMAKSKKDFIKSKNALWNERWLTEGKVINVKSVRKNIKDLVTGVMANSNTDRKYKSEVVDKTLIDAKSAYWLMKEGKHSEAAELLWNSAASMIENVDFVEDLTFNQYKDLRDYMRTTSFKLGEEYWSDVDFSAFRKRNFGRIKLVKGETNIDEIYQELQEKWPEWFDEDEQMTAPDQLLHIEEVLDAIQPYKIAYSSEEAEQLAGDIADVLYDIVYQGEEYKSIADTFKERYDAKTKALKARHEEALAKVRTRSDELLAAEKEKTSRQKERAELWKSRTFEEKAKRQKDKDVRKKAKYFGKISDNIDWLSTRLLNETKDKNIPEGFRRSLAHMLMQFDMQTERSKALEEKYGPAKKTLQMRELKNRLEKIANEDDTGEFRYDGYLFYLMDALAEKVDGKSIDSLDTEDLIAIDTMLKSIVHNFRNYNKIRLEEEKVAIANIGNNIIDAMDERIKKYGKRKAYKGARGLLDKLVNEGEETPIYFFERLDPTGQGIGAMYKELRRGEDRHIRNMNFLRNRFKEMFSEYSNEKKAGSKLEEWRDTSQAQTFNLENGSITLNPAQIMSLYCLSKRTQAMGHILGAGIVASPISFGAKMSEKFKGNEEQVDSVMIKYSEVQEIIATLTEEQVKLADEMQALMNNEMAAWGNETSLELHGIKLFRETDYFPIKSSNEVLEKPAEKRDVQEKIKNFGFTKPLTRNANNAIMIDDIFSVVADHCNKMSLYNSMAIPITDFMRVYNYKQKLDSGRQRTVQTVIGEAFTRKANDYIMKFIADVNGNTKTRSDAVDDLMNKTLANYKKASIGFNARVALQQPTAVFRALMAIDAKYFVGTRLIAPNEQKEMFEHCPIALWKSWGHYDMDMGRDIEDIMMNNDHSLFDTVTMGAYGMLDNMAWGKIWQAVKNEIKDKHPDVKVGSPAFYRLCNERASEVFDKTQVVDSIFHRSDIMRSKKTLTKMTTSFMAEPTLTYNVFRDSLVKAHELRKDGNKAEADKLLLKMGIVTTLNALAVSAAAALWDAVRGKGADDDDDDENLMEKGLMKLVAMLGGTDPWTKEEKSGKDLWLINLLNNFSDNAPWAQWNNIYFVKDIVSLKDGYGTSNMALEGWETLFKGITQAKKKIIEGSDKSWYDIFMNIAGGTGYLVGWPVKTFLRDAKALFEKAGIEVFAEDGSEPEVSLVDTLAEKIGYKPIEKAQDKKSKKEEKADEANFDNELKDYEESLSDNYSDDQKKKLVKQYQKKLESETTAEYDPDMNVKEHVQEGITNFEYEMEKRSLKAAENAAGKTGNARNDALWDVIAEGYTNSVESGNMGTIQAMRDAFVANGGDADWFDAKITDKMKSAYKKTIGNDPTEAPGSSARQELMHEYLTNHGVSDEEISEIVRKSNTARDLKAALRIGNEEYIIDELVPLISAGLTRADFEYLYKYRNYGAKDYDGKYTDPKYTKTTGTFIWPTDGVITSHFGYRNAPTAGASSNHPAIDIGAPKGTPVLAADGGVVIYAGSNGGYGNSVGVKHANGMVTYYNHLSAWNVKVGDQVGQGQQIAQVGSTGISTGPHLDFKILDENGTPVDPEKYLNKRG